ncbi:MAG: hypothetical protein KH301_08960 [Brachyspira sp.]|uniref:hypothetical protein n=1 Tax=Candidatus Scatousia sp. TaxID=3085663 RepID=UPI0040270326|nr:hypothetical protein [Brachyspira sp.]
MKYYIGLSLASGSSMDSGLAIFDDSNNLIMVDKLYKMNDIIHFFDNYSSTKDSEICVSMAWDKTMLNGKWRILSKPYQMVSTNKLIPNQDNWTQRYATRGSEYFNSLITQGINLNRFEIYLTRQSMHLNSCYLERSPADCKFLQQTLTNEWGIELPQNMMPMSQLEAIVGAILAKENYKNNHNIKVISNFRGQKVIDVIKNPNLIEVC